MKMIDEKTALVLIGFQNDYFAEDGVLNAVVEESLQASNTLANTCEFIDALHDTDVPIISTPILFTPNYEELIEPVGILKIIVEAGAFRAGTHGGATIDVLKAYGDRIIEIPGKRGLNAFSNTDLEETLRRHQVRDVLVAGIITSLCVDSHRSARLRAWLPSRNSARLHLRANVDRAAVLLRRGVPPLLTGPRLEIGHRQVAL